MRALILSTFALVFGSPSPALTFEADAPDVHGRCMADCAWALPCKKCDSCFQDPQNWVHPSDECKECFNGWCKLTSGCMDCLHGRCREYKSKCPSVEQYAPCYKDTTYPGCDQVSGEEMLECGLGLACEKKLFAFIKDIYSPCNDCHTHCAVCRPCIPCIDHPEAEGCDKCKACEPCTGCAACLSGDCPAYSSCKDCTLCIPCLRDNTLPGCDKCGDCLPCVKSIGCFHDQTSYAKYVFGVGQEWNFGTK